MSVLSLIIFTIGFASMARVGVVRSSPILPPSRTPPAISSQANASHLPSPISLAACLIGQPIAHSLRKCTTRPQSLHRTLLSRILSARDVHSSTVARQGGPAVALRMSCRPPLFSHALHVWWVFVVDLHIDTMYEVMRRPINVTHSDCQSEDEDAANQYRMELRGSDLTPQHTQTQTRNRTDSAGSRQHEMCEPCPPGSFQPEKASTGALAQCERCLSSDWQAFPGRTRCLSCSEATNPVSVCGKTTRRSALLLAMKVKEPSLSSNNSKTEMKSVGERTGFEATINKWNPSSRTLIITLFPIAVLLGAIFYCSIVLSTKFLALSVQKT